MASTGSRIDLTTLRVGAILNTASGSCDPSAETEVDTYLEEAGIALRHVWCGGPDELAGYFAEAKELKLDVLIVLGGDGTIRSAAELATPEGPYLLPLPGGTMNVLPKALYGDKPWREVLLETLEHPVLRNVSSGLVNDEAFYVSAMFGASTRIAAAREAIRTGAVGEALTIAQNVLSEATTQKVTYEFGKKVSGEAETIAVTCPLVSSALHAEEAVFEAAAFNIPGVIEALGLAASAAFGKWRDDANVIIAKADTVRLTSDTAIPAIFDGEQVELSNDVRIEFKPQAFKAVVPESTLLPQ
ncbi:MAG: diacylglycerol kinase family lipid kinase [Parcubacteria group bacterium]|nr:diacylglycerol kinase family lipid kinase [Parcubacteria group bacterium]